MRSYHEGMIGLLRTAWNAPSAAPPPPRRVWRDWALLALVVVVAALEATFRDLPYLLESIAFTMLAAPTLLWRRSRPLLMLAITFAITGVATLLLGDSQLFTSGFVLFILYALFRWGNGHAL